MHLCRATSVGNHRMLVFRQHRGLGDRRNAQLCCLLRSNIDSDRLFGLSFADVVLLHVGLSDLERDGL